MSSFDRITGNYTLETLGGSCGLGDIRFVANSGTGNFYINGNLIVTGQQSQVGSVNTFIADSFITLGNTQVAGDAGISVQRGGQATVSIKWNEAVDRWQITNDGTIYSNIAAGGTLSSVFEDKSPRLGAALDLNCFPITTLFPCNIVMRPGVAGTRANAAIQIERIDSAVTPNAVTNNTILFARAPGAGDTGLYVTGSTNRAEELITRRKALLFSLVL